jgi:hypothetical protein
MLRLCVLVVRNEWVSQMRMPDCGLHIEFAMADAGRQTECPQCQQPVQLPVPTAPHFARFCARNAPAKSNARHGL